jgi:exonuclease VII large subunit
LKTLERGYAIVRTDAHVVTDASVLGVGGRVDVRLARGSFGARVEETRK